jgi:hypothetical protein
METTDTNKKTRVNSITRAVLVKYIDSKKDPGYEANVDYKDTEIDGFNRGVELIKARSLEWRRWVISIMDREGTDRLEFRAVRVVNTTTRLTSDEGAEVAITCYLMSDDTSDGAPGEKAFVYSVVEQNDVWGEGQDETEEPTVETTKRDVAMRRARLESAGRNYWDKLPNVRKTGDLIAAVLRHANARIDNTTLSEIMGLSKKQIAGAVRHNDHVDSDKDDGVTTYFYSGPNSRTVN